MRVPVSPQPLPLPDDWEFPWLWGEDEGPVSKRPGPPRAPGLEFRLEPGAALAMRGEDDPENERWRDIAGHEYSDDFIRRFSYARAGAEAPRVLVRLEPGRETLAGLAKACGFSFARLERLAEEIPAHRARLAGREAGDE